jgi:hypothetical protein
MNLEDVEAAARAEAHAAYARLSDDAKLEFLTAHSWAEKHIGTALLFGLLVGAGVTVLTIVMFGL